jgi:hypothetical protein
MLHNPSVHFIHPLMHVPYLSEQLLIDNVLLMVYGVLHVAVTALVDHANATGKVKCDRQSLYTFFAERRKHVNKKY